MTLHILKCYELNKLDKKRTESFVVFIKTTVNFDDIEARIKNAHYEFCVGSGASINLYLIGIGRRRVVSCISVLT